jgi:hypothetical protein
MTRSSWHVFWMYLSAVAFLMCVFCVWLSSSYGPVLPVPQWATGNQALYLDYVGLVNALTRFEAHFWGAVAILSGLAWRACAVALEERRAYFGRNRKPETLAEGIIKETGIDVELRA